MTIIRVAAAAPKYNVLFIISDDLTSTALSCYGNTVCKTPNIDAIAAQGTRFENFYVASAVCMPNRASIMTGRYSPANAAKYSVCPGYSNPALYKVCL